MFLDSRVHHAGQDVTRADERVSMIRSMIESAQSRARTSAAPAGSLSYAATYAPAVTSGGRDTTSQPWSSSGPPQQTHQPDKPGHSGIERVSQFELLEDLEDGIYQLRRAGVDDDFNRCAITHDTWTSLRDSDVLPGDPSPGPANASRQRRLELGRGYIRSEISIGSSAEVAAALPSDAAWKAREDPKYEHLGRGTPQSPRSGRVRRGLRRAGSPRVHQ